MAPAVLKPAAMSDANIHVRRILFVDDDLAFLEMIERSFRAWAKGQIAIHLAHSAGQAISLMQQHAMDVVVLDIRMPVVDGLQFLHLLHRKHPNVRKVALTGYAEQDFRAACLKGGAELFLEKPRTTADFDSVFAAVAELLRAPSEDGFSGTIRNIGLHEILQLECLAHRSSILEVSANGLQGRIYIKEGSIAHAEASSFDGHDAFYHLMSLRGGSFALQEYEQPENETIQGPWEYLLMESSRMRDEGTIAEAVEVAPVSLIPDVPMNAFTPTSTSATPVLPSAPASKPSPTISHKITQTIKLPRPVEVDSTPLALQECTLSGGDGVTSASWQSADPDLRANFIEFLKFKTRQLAQGINIGAFRCLEAHTVRETIVVEVRREGGIYARCRPQNADPVRVIATAETHLIPSSSEAVV